MMPKVGVYPLCSECRAPYVLRHAFVFGENMSGVGMRWIWQRDCKHKKAVPLSSDSPRLRADGDEMNASEMERLRAEVDEVRRLWGEDIDRLASLRERLREVGGALQTLVALKDGPRDEYYEVSKTPAWEAARAALSAQREGSDPDPYANYCKGCGERFCKCSSWDVTRSGLGDPQEPTPEDAEGGSQKGEP